MKNILLLILFFSSFIQAQFTIKGTMTPATDSDWVILYKIEGTQKKYIQNSEIQIDSITIEGAKKAIASFSFQLPKDAKTGSYRAVYKLAEAGAIDFIFNQEDIAFTFHPDYPNQSVIFSSSKENIFYKEYTEILFQAQQKLDSIQVATLQDSTLVLQKEYKTALDSVNSIQKKYIEASKNMYVHPFIIASARKNPSKIIESPQKYMANIVNSFFSKINFGDKTLLNSSFLVDRIIDYIFYINYSDDIATQQKLYKKATKKVLSKIKTPSFKQEIIEFLIGEFEKTKNLELIDYLFKNHYDTLPKEFQDKKFKEEKLQLFSTEVGRIAPNFSWKEKGKTIQLSSLDTSKNYLLIFWSTTCSHCLREIPEVHKFLEENKEIEVIAFALEKTDFGWKNYKNMLPNWHHVLGLNKWKNEIARVYNIIATPSYFILDADKKIIAKPEKIEELKTFIDKLE